MVLRFPNMRTQYNAAQNMISRCCRDMCGENDGNAEEYAMLRKQFYIMENGDIFIDDAMQEIDYGYILKCLRAVDLLDYKIVVPRHGE